MSLIPILRSSIFGCAAFVLACSALAQDENAAPGQDDSAAAAIEFQHVVERYLGLTDKPVGDPGRVQTWRAETAQALDEMIVALDDLVQRTDRQPDVLLIKALCHARRARLILDDRRQLDKQYDDLKETQRQQPTEATSRQLASLAGPRLELAEKVAQEYATVDSVLTDALERAEAIKGEAEANLIRGVVLTQSAIVNDRVLEAAWAAGEAGVSVPDLPTREIRALLDDAQALLSKYLSDTPQENGLEWIRGQFYLGVVEYRRSLTQRKAGAAHVTAVDESREAMFYRAREVFAGLADPSKVLSIIQGPPAAEGEGPTRAQSAFSRSGFARKNYSEDNVANFYSASANLYLGLIGSIDPALDLSDPSARLNAAKEFLDEALRLDASDPQFTTLTVDMIPTSVERVTRTLKEAAEAAPARRPLNDLTLSFGLTTLYDTNVPLLGRNTAPPLHKSRKRDFRVGALFKLNYVMDLDALTPDDVGGPLSKWQLLFEARTSPTWNARIFDFNEQFYGATLNLRYEIVGPGDIDNIDGIYFHTRYDYDYILLNNDGFLRVNRVRPSLQIIALEQVVDTSIFFAYEDRNYLEQLRDQRFDRDGNYFSWGADTVFNLGRWVDGETLWKDRAWGRWAPHRDDRDYRRPMEASLGFEFTTNSTQGNQFDFKSQILTVGVKIPLPYGIDFATRALFEWQDYRGTSLVDHRRRGRKDFIQEYGFRLERSFYLTRGYDPRSYEFVTPLNLSRVIMTISGDIRFIIDDSNVQDRLSQNVFEYSRIIYGAGVRFDID